MFSQDSVSSAFAGTTTAFQTPGQTPGQTPAHTAAQAPAQTTAGDRPGQHPAIPPRGPLPQRIEWPTLMVAAAIYGGFGLVTWFHAVLPWWLLLPLGAYLVAWHGSLQHEVVHGHPTPWPRANELLVLPSLWLWLPFRHYRPIHLAHHNDAQLTDPLADPESYYVDAASWAAAGPLARAFLRVHNTLAGRLLLGPLRCLHGFYRSEIVRTLQGDRSHLQSWAVHAVGVALVLIWVVGVCGLPLWQYLLFFAYAGTSLTLLRSFLEHQARPEVSERSVIVEAGPLMSLLYLNNNLHLVHHDKPGLPWYRLPAFYRQRRALFLASNGGYYYKGYGAVFRRHFFRAKEEPLHPGAVA